MTNATWPAKRDMEQTAAGKLIDVDTGVGYGSLLQLHNHKEKTGNREHVANGLNTNQ